MRVKALRGVVVTLVAFSFLNIAGGRADASPKTIDVVGDRVFPESISSAPDGTLYVGSAGAGGILRALPGAKKAEPWIAPGAFGSRSIFGVLVDWRSNMLWACSNDLSASAGSSPTATSSALIGFDLKSGEGKVKANLPGSPTLCNDVAIDHDHNIYVTNGAAPQILKYDAQTKRLGVWLTDPQFQPKHGIGLDGIAVAMTDGTVYVDTYSEGKFFAIPVENGKPTSASPMTVASEVEPGERKLALPGALRPIFGQAFLLVEGAGRLDRIVIEGSAAIINTVHEGYHAPTGVTQTDGVTWIADGQLSDLFDTSKAHDKPHLPFQLLGIDY